MAEIVEMNQSSQIEDVPTSKESPTEDSFDNLVPQDIYANLITQEMIAIETLRNLRKIKKTILNEFTPPEKKFKIFSRNQYLSKLYNNTAKDFLKLLRELNVTVTPKHIVNPVNPSFRKDGCSGDGTRKVTFNMYFPNHASSEPIIASSFESIPEDSVLCAEEAIGYTLVTLLFEVDKKPISIIGKSICSSNDYYNGNLGVIFALRNAFEQIEARELNTPIKNLSNIIGNFQKIMGIDIIDSFKGSKNDKI